MTIPETTAPAPAGPKRIPFVTDAVRLARVLFSPTAVFEEQREAPTFWIPWLIVGVLMAAVAALNVNFTVAIARLGAACKGQPFPASAESVARIVAPLFTPVGLLVMLLITAGVMYLVLLAVGGEVRYKGLLTVAVFVGILGVLQMLLMFVVLKMRGAESLQTLADYQVSFGLDLLLPQDASLGRFFDGVLKGISPFSVWGLVLTAIGVRTMERTSKGAAWSAASVAFLLGLLIAGIANPATKCVQ